MNIKTVDLHICAQNSVSVFGIKNVFELIQNEIAPKTLNPTIYKNIKGQHVPKMVSSLLGSHYPTRSYILT